MAVGPANAALGKLRGAPAQGRLAGVGRRRGFCSETLPGGGGWIMYAEFLLHDRLPKARSEPDSSFMGKGMGVYRSSMMLLMLENGSPSPWKP